MTLGRLMDAKAVCLTGDILDEFGLEQLANFNRNRQLFWAKIHGGLSACLWPDAKRDDNLVWRQYLSASHAVQCHSVIAPLYLSLRGA